MEKLDTANITMPNSHIVDAEVIAKEIYTKYSPMQVNEVLGIINDRIKTQRIADLTKLEQKVIYLKEVISKLP